MATYRVHVENIVSAIVEVEWDGDDPPTADDLEELAQQSDDMPSGITIGAFGQASVGDGDWYMTAYTGPDGSTHKV